MTKRNEQLGQHLTCTSTLPTNQPASQLVPLSYQGCIHFRQPERTKVVEHDQQCAHVHPKLLISNVYTQYSRHAIQSPLSHIAGTKQYPEARNRTSHYCVQTVYPCRSVLPSCMVECDS